MQPWLIISTLTLLWPVGYIIGVTMGFEESGSVFSTHSKHLFAIVALIILDFYILNGFYSLYKQIKEIKSQTGHQIFYNGNEQSA